MDRVDKVDSTYKEKSSNKQKCLGELETTMNFLKHAYQQPLIFATGLAALVHSTWSLGTMFSGEQPAIENITTQIGWVHFAGWIIPALLIAFALDIGQIITSHEIRTRGMTRARGFTFIVFALATYYLQWLYMAHHMPLVELAEGISSIHRDAALWLRNMGLWLIPALLPLSTLLYTFSTENEEIQQPQKIDTPVITVEQPKRQELPEPKEELAELVDTLQHISVCPDCGWVSEEKENELSAKRALSAHRLHCIAQHQFTQENGAYDNAQ